MSLNRQLRALVILIAIGLFCSSTLASQVPARELSFFGLSILLSGKMLFGWILLGLACTGVQVIVRGHPQAQSRQSHLSILPWVLPSALTVAAWALLGGLGSVQDRAVGALCSGLALALIVIAEYYTIDPAARWRAAVRLSLELMAYLLVCLLYTAINLGIATTLLAATAVVVVSAALALWLLSDDERPVARIWPYALGLGALLGLISWMLSFWQATPLLRSAALVVSLYTLTGIGRQWLLRRLTRRVFAEYLVVGCAVLLLLLFFAR